jgi:hypothetical protein
MEMYESFLKSVDTLHQLIKLDLEIYLEEGVFLPEKGLEFNALEWWKTNALKCRILSKVIKDIFVNTDYHCDFRVHI